MDSTISIDPIDRSEVLSVTLGQKRPLTNGFESFDDALGYKKAKFDNKDVKLDVKRVAEIVLVLATMGRMRGGRKPSEVEVEMMREARAKLVDVCKEFAPKDIFPGEGFGSVIEDLGLNKLGEHKLGVRNLKLTISEKVLVTKRKMEKSEVFPLHSNMYTPPRLEPNVSGATESRGTSSSVRIFPSDKSNLSPVSSGSFQRPPNVAHASAANSRTLPYQLPTSEVRPGGSNSLHSERDYSSVTRSRAERPHFRIDGGANGSYPSQSQGAEILGGEHMAGKTPARSMQSQSASVAKGVMDKVLAHSSVKAEGSSDLTTARVSGQGITSKPSITQVPPNPRIANQHRTNFIPGPSLADTHREVSKIVQKLLQPYLLKHPAWTPPSRDYMSKALTCQMCKAIINEVDTAIVCDACERGYHLRCLQSNSKSIPRGEWQEWHCAKCLAISNGKPLPPKYGHVMRNISTPKLSSNSVVDQPSPDKKMQSSDVNASQQTTTTNRITGNDSKLTEMQLNQKQECREDKAPGNTCVSSLVEGSNYEKLKIVSESQPLANLEEYHHGDNHRIPQSITDTLAKQSQSSNLLSNIPEISPNGAIEEVAQGESWKTSEIGIAVGEKGPSSSSMHEVEWVGGALKEIDGKTYYQSCCINGTVYKVKDYVLFTSPTNKYLPNKLQAMWEDGKTTNKWVNVSRCFFPDDLPEGVGRPCAPESNEVYESNHDSTLAAGLIHSSCEVLPPSKFSEESAMQTRLTERGKESPKPIFLCKWFYDETKRLFRDVTC